KVDLVPLEIDGLGHPQAVPSHEQDQCGVTLPIATLTRRFDELAELALTQVFWPIAAVHRCPHADFPQIAAWQPDQRVGICYAFRGSGVGNIPQSTLIAESL